MKREDWRKLPRTAHTGQENLRTQPLKRLKVFNNPDVVTEAWYPAGPSRTLTRGQARSIKLTHQRVVLYRGQDGRVRALDAFCPHMGADLGNGRVDGNELECYFHRWRFAEDGALVACGKQPAPAGVCNRAYPVEEKYGWIWVYAGPRAPYPVPTCPGLEDREVLSWHIASPLLFAHHHVMMAGGIDLGHFAGVHGLDIDFALDVEQSTPEVADWKLEGRIPEQGWRARLGRWLLGDRFGYRARFAGGSVLGITYGPEQRFRGTGRPLPALHILWGCVAEASGVSRVHVLLLAARAPGLLGGLRARLRLLLTAVLLTVLRDDDVKAFPNMRFQPNRLTEADASVGRFIHFVNQLPASDWSRTEEGRHD